MAEPAEEQRCLGFAGSGGRDGEKGAAREDHRERVGCAQGRVVPHLPDYALLRSDHRRSVCWVGSWLTKRVRVFSPLLLFLVAYAAIMFRN